MNRLNNFFDTHHSSRVLLKYPCLGVSDQPWSFLFVVKTVGISVKEGCRTSMYSLCPHCPVQLPRTKKKKNQNWSRNFLDFLDSISYKEILQLPLSPDAPYYWHIYTTGSIADLSFRDVENSCISTIIFGNEESSLEHWVCYKFYRQTNLNRYDTLETPPPRATTDEKRVRTNSSVYSLFISK